MVGKVINVKKQSFLHLDFFKLKYYVILTYVCPLSSWQDVKLDPRYST